MTAARDIEGYIVDRNVYSMDPVPLEAKEYNRIYPFYDHLKQGRLTTTQCVDCGHICWPPRIVCPQCISDQLDWVDFPKVGHVYAYTVQQNGNPPGFPAPMIYALIDFDNGVRIICPVVDCKPEDVKFGSEVVLKVVPAPRDRVLFFFQLKSKSHQ
ncbi:MAG: Zn-ribbon domain-containing OB-fold protein [Deltaproteobacteria bacterium]|nr:Zn-ribbon domain-containing OB-fold protein [Deltaproteobacteria bacterium]